MSNAARLVTPNQFLNSIPARLAASGFNMNTLRPYLPASAKAARAMAANGSLQANALLRKDEWKELDQRVIDVARQRLTGIADLRSRGLVAQLGGLGTILSEYEKLGDMSGADLDMSGVSGGERDSATFDLVSVPVPIVHKDYAINIRRLLASRKLGNSIDTIQAGVAARRVSDKLEDILFNGASSIVVDANPLYGYTTHPDRTTGSASDFGTIANIFTAVNDMVADAEADYYFGPYVLYVATTQYAQMRQVYTDGSGKTAMARCLEAIPSLEAIRPADVLTDGNLVLVTMVPDVVDLAIAQDVTNVQWEELGGMVQYYKVMAAMVPRVKSDSGSRSGIVHYTGA